MTEFWESSFIEKQTMWGFEPSDSAILAKDIFAKNQFKNILIPGIGYGRNAKIFQDNGMEVTGIEISQTAIDLARTHYSTSMKIYHGSVAEMPFDDEQYDGIFCYALIHLLNSRGRRKLLRDCYNQLKTNGQMIFVTVSKNHPMFEKGKLLSKDRFAMAHGVSLYFYDSISIEAEFGKYGLVNSTEIDEANKHSENQSPTKFWFITCIKK